jgi:hypothetical protein
MSNGRFPQGMDDLTWGLVPKPTLYQPFCMQRLSGPKGNPGNLHSVEPPQLWYTVGRHIPSSWRGRHLLPGKLRRSAVWVAAIVTLVVALSCGASDAATAPPHRTPCELVVLASPDDAYFELAEEIATAEGAPLAADLEEALTCGPEFLLWIASPEGLSEAALVAFGTTMQAHTAAVASGIITGTTLEQARSLWQRRAEVRGDTMAAVNAPNPAAHIQEGRILMTTQGRATEQPLTRESFLATLRSVDALTFTGHGGNNYLRLDSETTINSSDLPRLDGVVVSTGSCQTLRPWHWDSIALSFVDQGASAYAGFVFSPNEGYIIGEFNELPFRFTWPGVPIGHVLQAQTRGTLQGFAHFPTLFLLGDPRIALQAEPPYRSVDDRVDGDRRLLTFEDVPAGVIPLRISAGAEYHFVRVPGVTAATDGDPFYNSRLQMVNVRTTRSSC